MDDATYRKTLDEIAGLHFEFEVLGWIEIWRNGLCSLPRPTAKFWKSAAEKQQELRAENARKRYTALIAAGTSRIAEIRERVAREDAITQQRLKVAEAAEAARRLEWERKREADQRAAAEREAEAARLQREQAEQQAEQAARQAVYDEFRYRLATVEGITDEPTIRTRFEAVARSPLSQPQRTLPPKSE